MKLRLSSARLATMFLISVCVLALEIEIMRTFAISSWSNFGSMVISIALLGFGLAGTVLTFSSRRMKRNPDGWLSASAFALGPCMAVSHCIAQFIAFNPVLIASDPSQLWRIGAYYLAYFPPFFVGGLYIGAAFASLSRLTHRLYFWNMVGSGLGGLFILLAMFLVPPEGLIYVLVGLAALPALLSSVHWSAVDGRFTVRAAEAALGLSLASLGFLLLASFGRINVSDFKGISYARAYPDSKEVYRTFSPHGEIEVFSSSFFHFAPGLSDTAGSSLSQMPRNAFLGMFTDGDGPVGIMRKLSPQEEGYIGFIPMSAPYILLSNPKVLLLRLGGGMGVHTALHNGASKVTVVEPNPDLVHMMRDVPFFRTYTGDILRDPRVSVEGNEVRAFAGSTREKFDLVEIGLIDSLGLSQVGGYPMEENYTYTVEAIREYLKCLAPEGILSITVWDRLNPPRNVPKLLSSVAGALKGVAGMKAEKSIFAFNLLLSTATVLIKNGEYTQRQIGLLNSHCKKMAFDVDYYPGAPDRPKDFGSILQAYSRMYAPTSEAGEAQASDANTELIPSDLYHFALKWLLGGKADELFSRYVFDIRPATDEKPYYSGYIKLKMIPTLLQHMGEISEEWGYILLLATFLQSVFFGFFIVLLPLTFRWGELFKGKRGTLGIILYFSCLGLGYMMAEIFLIQRFVYFLSDPVYTNAIVLTVLLVSSGVGSLLAERWTSSRRLAVRISAAGIALFACLAFIGFPKILPRFLGAPLPAKALLAAGLIFPLGLCLGIPFPSGLSALSETRAGILPWAWGVNGALSVVGSVLTRIMSTSAGFSVVLAVTAGLYLIAGLLFPVPRTNPSVTGLSFPRRSGRSAS